MASSATVSTSTTVTDPATVTCPYCRTSNRIRGTSDTGRIQTWSYDRCRADWVYTVPDTRAAAVLLTTDLPETITATIQHMAIIACIGTRRP
jgi:transposase-like protein